MATTSPANNSPAQKGIASLAGTLLLAMILITITAGLFQTSWSQESATLAGLFAWTAAFLLFSGTSSALKIQVSILITIGGGLIAYVALTDGSSSIISIIGANTGLLSMIAAVGFLRLVALPEQSASEQLPRGKEAFWKTLAGLNISSSIINISSPILIGDRIHRSRPLDRLSIQSFTRVFCSAASWSPFFAAMAVVLTYVKGAELSSLIFYGLPFTLMGVGLTVIEAHLRYPQQLDNFIGYPTQLAALGIPLLLVIAVGGFSLVSENTPTLVIISVSALLITVLLLLRRGMKTTVHRISEHVVDGLPSMRNELCLFLSAGVLATGISALINSGQLINPLPFFDHRIAGLLLLAMLLMSTIGIHPVIQISSISGLLLQLNPDPSLLAATFLFAWHLGTCASPLSGTNLVFQGRYGVPAWRIAMWNLPYGLLMVMLGGMWLWVAPGLLQ